MKHLLALFLFGALVHITALAEDSTWPEGDVPRFIVERADDGIFRPVVGELGLDAMRQQLESPDFQRLVVGLETPIAADEVMAYGPNGLDL